MQKKLRVPLHLFLPRHFAVVLLLLIAFGPGCSLFSVRQVALRDPDNSVSVHPPVSFPPDSALSTPPSAAPSASLSLHPGDPDVAEAGSSEARVVAHEVMPTVLTFDFPVVFNDQVKAMLGHYQRHKSVGITQAFARAKRYTGMMRAIFREQGLPQELVNLAFVESEVNPRARSHAHAAGIWQFIPSTARF